MQIVPTGGLCAHLSNTAEQSPAERGSGLPNLGIWAEGGKREARRSISSISLCVSAPTHRIWRRQARDLILVSSVARYAVWPPLMVLQQIDFRPLGCIRVASAEAPASCQLQ